MSHGGLSRLSGALGICAFVAVVRPAHADPRAVVELFTSQGCSSCPAADKILGELSKDPSIIALSLPIDYWDYLGWKDTLADNRFTARQKAYSQVRGDRDVYTPQVIVNGSLHVVGNDRAAIENAMHDTRKNDDVMSVPVSMSVSGRQLNVSVASASANHPSDHGEVWIYAISSAVPISWVCHEPRVPLLLRNDVPTGDSNLVFFAHLCCSSSWQPPAAHHGRKRH